MPTSNPKIGGGGTGTIQGVRTSTAIPRAGADTATAARIADLERALRDDERRRSATRLATLVSIAGAMARLRELGTATAIIDAAPAELCRACGFSRALISRVDGTAWIPEASHADELNALGNVGRFPWIKGVGIPLRAMPVETELVRRRRAVLVSAPEQDRRVSPRWVRASQCGSYAAAPVVSGNRAIGLLHADRLGQDREVDRTDADNLMAFAVEFGVLFECVTLTTRLQRQTAQISAALQRAVAVADETARAQIALARDEPAVAPPSRPVASGHAAAAALLLTAREREVLELMVAGAFNRDIAQELGIALGTVKSHTKHILRKLRVTNRSEAVAWCLRQRPQAARAASA